MYTSTPPVLRSAQDPPGPHDADRHPSFSVHPRCSILSRHYAPVEPAPQPFHGKPVLFADLQVVAKGQRILLLEPALGLRLLNEKDSMYEGKSFRFPMAPFKRPNSPPTNFLVGPSVFPMIDNPVKRGFDLLPSVLRRSETAKGLFPWFQRSSAQARPRNRPLFALQAARYYCHSPMGRHIHSGLVPLSDCIGYFFHPGSSGYA